MSYFPQEGADSAHALNSGMPPIPPRVIIGQVRSSTNKHTTDRYFEQWAGKHTEYFVNNGMIWLYIIIQQYEKKVYIYGYRNKTRLADVFCKLLHAIDQTGGPITPTPRSLIPGGVLRPVVSLSLRLL